MLSGALRRSEEYPEVEECPRKSANLPEDQRISQMYSEFHQGVTIVKKKLPQKSKLQKPNSWTT